MILPDGLIVALAVALLLVLIGLRTPIFIALAVSGLLGLLGLSGFDGLTMVPLAVNAQLQEYALVAAPLYIMLGEALAVSGLGRDLFAAAHRWLHRMPGGLGASAIASSTLFGAMSGVSISSVALIGRMAVPEMLSRGYKPSFASASVTASGALAMLIPPSLMFILYASVTGESVAELFAGGIVPGLLLAALMIGYVVLRAKFSTDVAPRNGADFSWRERWTALAKVTPALVLIVLVLGSIYLGVATPTEAAAVGALLAFALTGLVYRQLGWANLKLILGSTVRVSGSLLVIVGSAFVFTQMLVVARVPEAVTNFVLGLDVPAFFILLALMVALILLGCLVDAASLLLVVTPILVPVIEELGFDPLWFGVVLVLNLEMAVITPPVGLNLYTMKSAVPELDLGDVIRGVTPYLAIEFALIAVLIAFPGMATYLPSILT